MTTVVVIHEVTDGEAWAKAWHKGPGSRHEMFDKLGIKARNLRDPGNPNLTGVLMEVPDIEQLKAFLDTDEGRAAMQEDGLKVETLRVLTEFTP